VTIALTYLDDLSRVRIAGSGLLPGAVRCERSINGIVWDTVRGGVAMPVQDTGDFELFDYEFAADVENHYRVCAVDPPAGLLITDVNADHASTPDHASLDITGDLDLRCDLQLDSWGEDSVRYLVSKYVIAGDQRSYALRLNPDGLLQFAWSNDGSTILAHTAGSPLPALWPELWPGRVHGAGHRCSPAGHRRTAPP
jgi:hypothetical protein